MRFLTSYYANFKNIPSNYMCIGISRFCPDGFMNEDGSFVYENFQWSRGNFLAPSAELLSDMKSGNITEDEYEKRYIEGLYKEFEGLNDISTNQPFKDIPDWLDALCELFEGYDAIVFLCYESPEKICHRHILAKILTNIYHIPCNEIEINNKQKQKENYSLF